MAEAENKLYRAYVNPLSFLEADNAQHEISSEAILQFLCTPETSSDPRSVIERYREIDNGPDRLLAPPAEPQILEKLIWPLRHAKASYMLGNYLGTIALCGMVAEMLAIFLFDLSNVVINGKPLDEPAQKKLFGRTFEKLGQEPRVDVLHAFGKIDDELKASFDVIRDKRRRYLHLFSQDHKQLKTDATTVFSAAVKIVAHLTGRMGNDGAIVLNQDLIKYLEQRGLVEKANVEEPRAAQ